MAEPHYYSMIMRKINSLKKRAKHFQHCKDDALKKIEILKSALLILNSNHDNFFLNSTELIEKYDYTYLEHFLLSQSPRKMVSQILKAHPNQWLSTREIVLKVFEMEKMAFDEMLYIPIRQSISAILRRQQERGIIQRRYDMKSGNNQSEWLLPLGK